MMRLLSFLVFLLLNILMFLSDSFTIVDRSYGRAPKMIHLESNFVQFKEELLPKEGNKALLTVPFLHIYWTECCVSIHCGEHYNGLRTHRSGFC